MSRPDLNVTEKFRNTSAVFLGKYNESLNCWAPPGVLLRLLLLYSLAVLSKPAGEHQILLPWRSKRAGSTNLICRPFREGKNEKKKRKTNHSNRQQGAQAPWRPRRRTSCRWRSATKVWAARRRRRRRFRLFFFFSFCSLWNFDFRKEGRRKRRRRGRGRRKRRRRRTGQVLNLLFVRRLRARGPEERVAPRHGPGWLGRQWRAGCPHERAVPAEGQQGRAGRGGAGRMAFIEWRRRCGARRPAQIPPRSARCPCP